MSAFNVKVDKFTGRNSFGLWQITMRSLLKQQGLWESIPGKLKKDDMKEEEWNSMEEKAHSTIMLCLCDYVIIEVADQDTAAKICTLEKIVNRQLGLPLKIRDQDYLLRAKGKRNLERRNQTIRVQKVLDLSDTRTMAAVLSSFGARVEFSGNEVVVSADQVGSVEPDADLIARIRGGFFVLGPLLARFGRAPVGLTGGCDIGARPVDIYVSGLRRLGAVVELRDNKIEARAANGRGLVGGKFRLDYSSFGATQTLVMAAAMAEGRTLLSNVAREPEITDLACFLTKSGANVEGVGTDEMRINGRRRLFGAKHTIMSDRIEAGTFMLAAAITRSSFSLSRVDPGCLSSLIDKLSRAGCEIRHEHDTLEISALRRRNGEDLRGFNFKTLPYPGFPTDLQPPTMALLSTCDGLSVVEESVFENRFTHVKDVQKLGAKIHTQGSTAYISGKGKRNKPYGARVGTDDLRGGIALVLAGLAAEGVTQVSRMRYVDRGYENLETKLRSLGADVQRLKETISRREMMYL